MTVFFPNNLLWIQSSTADALLRLYDYPNPKKPEEIIEGYDKQHALRTAKMCAAVAHYLGYSENQIQQYQITCLLHDLGRVGLDKKLFGKIWTWARKQNIPTRPAEWRAAFPETFYGEETEDFLDRYQTQLEKLNIQLNNWTKEQVEMRLGYARRLKRMIKRFKPEIKALGIQWEKWMELVISYYYYPEKLKNMPDWIHEFGEILVACEQLEANSNRERGNDYYDRNSESFSMAFHHLDNLQEKGLLSSKVLNAVRSLTATGIFDEILRSARNEKLAENDLNFLRSLSEN